MAIDTYEELIAKFRVVRLLAVSTRMNFGRYTAKHAEADFGRSGTAVSKARAAPPCLRARLDSLGHTAVHGRQVPEVPGHRRDHEGRRASDLRLPAGPRPCHLRAARPARTRAHVHHQPGPGRLERFARAVRRRP